ncbi:MAG TPA: AraC family transcriptional regulator [Sphingobacterium sp.]|jgi:AraC family transcriptional regulator of adaptative response / methylphosphotriester-DNA alkyltransferase methyltransferase|nr:AraC family transcriptional regulator [Sphingobacterium sp.]
MENENQAIPTRSAEIKTIYLEFLDRHITAVVSGEVDDFMKINQIADRLCVSHKHLTDTIQKETGNHPCYHYDMKIVDKAKELLLQTDKSVAEIARILTYDPSNFTKFFKKFVGSTPGQFRKKP